MTPEELQAKVKIMRELGVTEADGIRLGPPVSTPKPEETKEQALARIAAEENRRMEIAFAASSTRPRRRA